MTVLVDMDDTIEQLLKAWLLVLNTRYDRDVTYESITSWNIVAAYPGLTFDQVYNVINEPGFWSIVLPMDGAPEALKRLQENGHDVYIVTATPYESVAEKMSGLLFRYFPFISWDHVIITSKKQMIKGDVLIDDGVHNLVGGSYEKILMTAPHNRSYDAEGNGMIRVKSWNEALIAVEKIAERLKQNGQEAS